MAAKTWAGVNATVADMLGRSDLSSQIALESQSAIRHYQSRRFWFNESRVSFSCSSTITEYTLSASTSVLSVLSVQITHGGTSYVINPIPEEERLAYDSNNIKASPPTWYSMYGGLFIPYPQPSGVYTATLNVVRQPDTLSASTDTNVFLEHAEDLIEARTAAGICLRYTHNDDRAKVYKLLEQEALNELLKRDSRLTPSRIVPTNF